MAGLKKGQIVRIADHKLGPCRFNGICSFMTEEMAKHIGKVYRVVENVTSNRYTLDFDARWWWSECMLEPIAEGVQIDISEFSYPSSIYVPPFSSPISSIKKREGLMTRLTTLAKKMLDADTKALVKANVLDSELNVNDSRFVLSFLVNKYKKELAVEARALVKEREEEDC